MLEDILLALSLCADCFAVCLCSSVTLEKISRRQVARIALLFSVIQSGLLLAGWLFGEALVGLVLKASGVIGFLLLLYVGGSMLLEGIRGKEEARNLEGLRNIILSGVATSIDALAVGAARSMQGGSSIPGLFAAVFIITALSVVLGMYGGSTLGRRVGRISEIFGGTILILIGLNILL